MKDLRLSGVVITALVLAWGIYALWVLAPCALAKAHGC